MKVVITGSLGNVSRPLAQQLLDAGHSVVIISSNPEKHKDIETLTATPAIGRLTDADFLTGAFAGADAVYGMIPFNFNVQDQDEYFRAIAGSYVQAIKSADVKKAVFLSGWTAGIVASPHLEAMLNQLADIDLAELRPGFFYTNFYSMMGTIRDGGVIMSNYGGDDKVAFVSPHDIATAAFEELTTSFEGRKVRYVASEELTCNDAAAILGEAIGKPELKWIPIAEEQVLNSLLSFGTPLQLAEYLVKMQVAIHSGIVYENYLHHRPVLGQTKLKDFAKAFAGVYHQQK